MIITLIRVSTSCNLLHIDNLFPVITGTLLVRCKVGRRKRLAAANERTLGVLQYHLLLGLVGRPLVTRLVVVVVAAAAVGRRSAGVGRPSNGALAVDGSAAAAGPTLAAQIGI